MRFLAVKCLNQVQTSQDIGQVEVMEDLVLGSQEKELISKLWIWRASSLSEHLKNARYQQQQSAFKKRYHLLDKKKPKQRQ